MLVITNTPHKDQLNAIEKGKIFSVASCNGYYLKIEPIEKEGIMYDCVDVTDGSLHCFGICDEFHIYNNAVINLNLE